MYIHRAVIQVAKWGDILAVRLPATVVEALELKEGDDIEIRVADRREPAVSREPGRDELLKGLRAFRALASGLQVRSGRGECPITSSIALRVFDLRRYDPCIGDSERMPGSLLRSRFRMQKTQPVVETIYQKLGGREVLGEEVTSEADLARLIRRRLPLSARLCQACWILGPRDWSICHPCPYAAASRRQKTTTDR